MSNNLTTLYLNTAMISNNASLGTVNNSVGYWNSGRQTFGFYVKLRQLLGDKYEKYNKFILSLVKYTSFNEANMTNAIVLETQIGGLNWINNSYDQSTRANGYWAPLNVEFTNGAQFTYVSSIFPSQTDSLIFQKGDSDILIEFRCINSITRALAVPSSNYLPTFGFYFNIEPVIE